MKVFINKNKYSGGVYFTNTIAILSTLVCCDVAYAEYKDVSEVINLFNNISWRIVANNKVVSASESNWIAQEQYNESIIKVMAQAIADCITDRNEFANKGEKDVITFNVNAKTYNEANWNAVVLWNYLHVLKYDYLNDVKRNRDEIFEDVRKRICDNYPTEGVVDLAGKLEKAISDIKEYDKELALESDTKKFFRCYKKTIEKTIDDLLQENNGSWMPIGQVGVKNDRWGLAHVLEREDGQGIWQISMKVDPEKRCYRPIKIKEKYRVHYIYDYEFNIYGNSGLCEIIEEAVEYLNDEYKPKKKKYVLMDTNVLSDTLHKLFSDLNFGFAYNEGWSPVIKN